MSDQNTRAAQMQAYKRTVASRYRTLIESELSELPPGANMSRQKSMDSCGSLTAQMERSIFAHATDGYWRALRCWMSCGRPLAQD